MSNLKLKSYSYSKYHFDKSRLEELANPKERSEKFIPDRPSPYWVDYVIDPLPQTLTDPQELIEYYRKFQDTKPRLLDLAKPKPEIVCAGDPRPKSAFGVPMSALTYEPSERIKQLAQHKYVDKLASKQIIPDRKPSTSSRSKSPSARQPRHPRKKESTDSTKFDLGKGDFRNRSKYRIDATNSKLSTMATNSHSKSKPQIQIHNHVAHMHRNDMRPIGISSKPPLSIRPYVHSVTAIGNIESATRLLIDRSFAASRVNVSARSEEIAEHQTRKPTPVLQGTNVVRNHPVSMKYVPMHGGCTSHSKKKYP